MKLSAIGQALRRRRREDRARARPRDLRRGATQSARPSPSTWRTTPPPTRRSAILAELRADFPDTGAVLQAYLHRTEGDCRDLADRRQPGPAVQGRLRRAGVGRVPEAAGRRPVLRALHERPDAPATGYPMLATHDPRLIAIGTERAQASTARRRTDFELQMLYGIRPDEQRRLAAAGHTVRVYVPYGAAVVRLPDAPAGRTPGQPGVLRPLAGHRRAEPDDGRTSRSSAAARSARRCCPGCCAASARADDIVVVREAPRAGRRTSPHATACRRVDVAERGRGGPHAGARRQAAGHRRAARRAGRGGRRRSTWSCRSPPASPPRTSSARLPDGVPVVRCMPNTPALVDEAMTAVSAGAHADEAHLAIAEALLGAVGQGGAGAGVAAGRGDRAVRVRARRTSSSWSRR